MDEVRGALPVGDLQLARRAVGGHRGLMPGQHRHHVPAVAHWGRLDVSAGQPRILLGRNVIGFGGAGGEGLGDQRQPLGGHDGAHRVGLQHGRRRVRPALRHAHQHAVVAAHPHQIVGEGQVGQQLPLPDHRVQVVDRVARQHGVLGEQITEWTSNNSRVVARGWLITAMRSPA